MKGKITIVLTKTISMLIFISSPLIAGELHQHIEVSLDGQQVKASFCRPEKGCSLVAPETIGLPAGQEPLDLLTGTPIYVSEFIIFPDRTAIDSPGFEGLEGDLMPGDKVRYLATGHLSYWGLDQQQWTLAPEAVQIRLVGGLELEANQDCGQVICIPNTIVGETLFKRDGISGTPSLIVGEVRVDGSLHTHLDWIVETEQGAANAPLGAYMVELQLVTDNFPQPSDTLWIMFNNGLTLEEFQLAVTGRVIESSIDTESSDQLFDWAEMNYPELLPYSATSFIALGYYARCYGNGACVGVKDQHVFAIGGDFGHQIINLGGLEALKDAASIE